MITADDLRKLPTPYGYKKPRFVFRNFRITPGDPYWRLAVLAGRGIFASWVEMPFVTERQCRNLYDKFTLLRPAMPSQRPSEAFLLRSV